MRHVDHVGNLAHRFPHRDMVNVDAGQRDARQRRAKQIIRLEIANGFPQRREQIRVDLQTRFARDPAVRLAQRIEFVTADFCGCQLFLQTDSAGVCARPKMMAGLPIGANDDFGAQPAAGFAFPQLEGARGGEFVVIEMRVDEKNFHAAERTTRRGRLRVQSPASASASSSSLCHRG